VLKVVFSNTASNNLISQALYIFEQTQSIALSDKYLDDMKEYIVSMLSSFPKAGRPSEELAPHTRKLVYQGYSIIYRVGQERIEILTLYRENLPK
jgi:plasmid stabilization system protein ParE